MTSPRRLLATVLAVPAAAAVLWALAVPASAAEGSVTGVSRIIADASVTVPLPVRRDCRAAPVLVGDGATSLPFGAPASTGGWLTARIAGPDGDDWDLALFSPTGERLSASSGFTSTERVDALLAPGERATLQLCRRGGADDAMRVQVAFTPASVAPVTTPSQIVQVTLGRDGAADLRRLEASGLDVTHDVRRDAARVAVYSDADRATLAGLGLPTRVVTPDLAAVDRAARAAEAAAAPTGLPSGRTTYRHLDDYQAELKALAEANPTLVRPVIESRKSVEGREISGVEIATGVTRTDDGRPVFLNVGLHHSREWPSAEVPMEWALDLVAGVKNGDPTTTDLLARTRAVVIPVQNPDGFTASRESPDGAVQVPIAGISYPGAITGSGAYRRKNCALAGDDAANGVTVDNPCALKTGVDLNRNYGAYWGGNGASTKPTSQTYRGRAPYSEPEVTAFHELSQRYQDTVIITNHNVAALVLRPPGFKALGLAPDEAALKVLGDAMADATGYESQYGYELYEVTGATEDWNYVAQGSFGYTIELGGSDPTGLSDFHGPYQQYVVDEYLGYGDHAGRGVREAYFDALTATGDSALHSVIEGSAPAGTVLRLTKSFDTTTSPICQTDNCDGQGAAPPMQLPDTLVSQLVVGPSGTFTWHVNPSTRPFYPQLMNDPGAREAWTLQCETTDGQVLARKTLVVDRGQRVTVSPCPAPAANGSTPPPPAAGTAPAPAAPTGASPTALPIGPAMPTPPTRPPGTAPATSTPTVSKALALRRFGGSARRVTRTARQAGGIAVRVRARLRGPISGVRVTLTRVAGTRRVLVAASTTPVRVTTAGRTVRLRLRRTPTAGRYLLTASGRDARDRLARTTGRLTLTR